MRKIAVNFLLIIVAIAISLTIAETASRIFLSPPQKIFTSAKKINFSNLANGQKQTISISQHPDQGGLYKGTATGRRLNPNKIVTIENHRLSNKRVVIETNSIGYRNPEITSKEGVRILFLGDSVTFQDFLNEDETFVRLIEKKSRDSNKNWETINAGVGAISLKTELAILLESGLSLKPDIVVLNFYLNDFQESKGVNIISLPPWMEQSWFLYHLVTTANQLRGKATMSPQNTSKPNFDLWLQDFENRVEFADGNFNESPQAFNTMVKNSFADFGGAWSQHSWSHMYPLFEELKRLSYEHDFRLFIVVFPIYQQVYTEFVDDYPQQQLLRIGRELDTPVLDLLPAFRAEALRLRDPSIYHSDQIYQDLFYDQCHHTSVGSALVANQIFTFLSSN